MGKPVTIVIPDFIYSIYEDAAKALGDITLPEVMCAALQAYAQFLFEEMRAEESEHNNRELSLHQTKKENEHPL